MFCTQHGTRHHHHRRRRHCRHHHHHQRYYQEPGSFSDLFLVWLKSFNLTEVILS